MKKQEIEQKVNDFIDNQELQELAIRTIKSYQNALTKFIEFLPNEFELDKHLIMKWKKSLVEPQADNKIYSLKTRNQFIVVINKFLYFLDHKDCHISLFKEQEKSSLEDYIEPQEHKRMLRWSKQLGLNEAYYIMRVFAISGARISELQYFTVKSLESNYIKGAYNKGKERILIMTNELRRDLKQYCKINKINEGYIFRSPDSRFINNPTRKVNDSTVWRWLKRIARAAKINPNKIHAHAWRHMFAKQCKANGIDLDELADILGHNNINTTAIYTKTSMKEKREKLERIRY